MVAAIAPSVGTHAMVEWLTGPEAVGRLRAWCAEHGTTVSRLVGQCTPPVARSTVGRWAGGAAPDRGTWLRLEAEMAAVERKELDYLLGAGG